MRYRDLFDDNPKLTARPMAEVSSAHFFRAISAALLAVEVQNTSLRTISASLVGKKEAEIVFPH